MRSLVTSRPILPPTLAAEAKLAPLFAEFDRLQEEMRGISRELERSTATATSPRNRT